MSERVLENGMVTRLAKKEAAALQIDTAARLFLAGELVPSITLSAAAEDSLPDVDGPYLFPMLNSNWANRKGCESSPFNEVRNWLKHAKDEENIEKHTNDAVIMLVRAISKYTAVFGTEFENNHCKQFYNWMRVHRSYWLSGRQSE